MTGAFERIGTALDIDGDSFASACDLVMGAPATAGCIAACALAFADGAAIDNIAVGEGFRLQVMRDHDHASDGATGDAELRFIEIKET